MALILAFEYLSSKMRFSIIVTELKGALCYDSVNTFFVVEFISCQGMAAQSQGMVMSARWMSMPRDLIKSRPIIILYRSMLRLTTCSDLLVSLLAFSSGKLKLVSVLVLEFFTIVWFTWYDLTSCSIVLPVSIYALIFRLWSICFRCIIYARFMLYLCDHFSYNYFNCTSIILPQSF